VQARTAVAVAASSDFEVEGAVHPILLRAEDAGQVVRHGAAACAGKSTVHFSKMQAGQQSAGFRNER
jgi:hypothetical protein